MRFDVFNGDADGICALIQLRLAEPLQSTLVTGVKRDIQLLDRIDEVQPGDSLTVLDISMQKNSRKIAEFLEKGAIIFYADHHLPGEIPVHENLTAIIDTSAEVCTSLLVNSYLKGKFPLWAITAAFGDNLAKSAEQLASVSGINASDLEALNNLGVLINYNGYGNSISDLHFPPAELYREMVRFVSPLEFISQNRTAYQKLENGYRQDMSNAQNTGAEFQSSSIAVYLLPDEAWSRRVSGVFSNELANNNPERAHAVLTHNEQGGFLISVRAPLKTKTGADEFCSGFATGGGRKSAAGINHLPKDELADFIKKFESFYSTRA